MSDRLDLTANILCVRFKPHDFITIEGMVWSKHREGLCVDKLHNRYTKKWFWNRDLPEPVSDLLIEASKQATESLVQCKALPTFWPTGLTEQKEEYPFNISVDEFCIYNADWNKDQRNIATFRIFSGVHNPGKIDSSEVTFDVDFMLEKKIFSALYEHI